MDPNTSWQNSFPQGATPANYPVAGSPVVAPIEQQYVPPQSIQPIPQGRESGMASTVGMGANVYSPLNAQPNAVSPSSPTQPVAQTWSPVAPGVSAPQPVPGYGYTPQTATYLTPQPPAPTPAALTTPQLPPQPTQVEQVAVPIASEASLKRLRKKVIGIIVMVAGFMTIGAAAALIINNLPTTYAKSDLITYSSDGVSFQYPKQWLALDPLPSNAQIAFGDNADSTKATAVIILTSSDQNIGPVDGASDQQIATFEENLKAEFASSSFQDSLKQNTGCDTINTSNTADAPATFTLIGVHFSFTCTRSGQGGVTVKGYLGIAPSSGKIYMVELVALSGAYDANATIFDSMLSGLQVQ